MARKKVTIRDLQRKYEGGDALTMVTCYDYPSALIVDRAGLDMILVGDSLGMVVMGYESTVPVTMEEMLHHARMVTRGAKGCFVMGDMPFGSYEGDVREGVRNAQRFMKEAGVDAVKLEGGRDMAPVIGAITRAAIPVMAHIGLTPQSVSKLGGFRTQGRTAADAARLLDDALAVQEAGAFSVVLEAVTDRVASYITSQLKIPTIGIGAGPGTSGQVLVFHDMLGLFDRFQPKFVRRYAEIGQAMQQAFEAYREEVKGHQFPAPEHCHTIDDAEYDAFVQGITESQSDQTSSDETLTGLYGGGSAQRE
jgi:3-methyl-2-oxobutanoate hydroxymethyltransferase